MKDEISDAVKELVILRIETQTPQHLKLSIGSYGSLSRDELVDHVRKGDVIGKQVVEMHLSFLKALTSGEFMKAVSSVNDE